MKQKSLENTKGNPKPKESQGLDIKIQQTQGFYNAPQKTPNGFSTWPCESVIGVLRWM